MGKILDVEAPILKTIFRGERVLTVFKFLLFPSTWVEQMKCVACWKFSTNKHWSMCLEANRANMSEDK